MAKGKRKLKVDFTGVKTFVKCPEGQHVVKIEDIKEDVSQAGNDVIKATFKVVKGNSKGAVIYENFVLGETSLWKLKALLEALGMKADGKTVLNLDILEGKTLIVTVVHEEYDNKERAKISEFKNLKATAKGVEEDEADEDDVEDDEEDEVEEKPKKSKKNAKPTKKSTKKTVVEDDDEDEDEDDDFDDEEEEEEEKPKKSKKKKTEKKSSKKPKKSKKSVEDEDDDFDDEDDDDDWEEV